MSCFLTKIPRKIPKTANTAEGGRKSEKAEPLSADIVQEYKRFVIKLSLFLLGYNLDKVNAFSNNKNLREMNDAKKFILILEFFIFYSHKDEKNKNQFSYNNNDWISKYLQLKSEYENNDNIIKDDDIMLFLNKKPKNEIMSVKYFFIAENN